MKKNLLLLTLAAMLSVVTYAQKPFEGARAAYAAPLQVTAIEGVQQEIISSSANVGMRKAVKKAGTEVIVDQPEGELKLYTRSGSYITGGHIYSQNGFAYVVFAEDGKVYLKDPVSQIAMGTWVEGTINDEGTKITVPLGQVAGYVSLGGSQIPLQLGLTYPSAKSEGEITYTVSDNRIVLDTYTTYNVGVLGYCFTFNGTSYTTRNLTDWSWGDYATAYDLFEEPETVAVPDNLETKEYPVSGTEFPDEVDYSSTVKVGWDNNDVYIQGLNKFVPEAWVKGTYDAAEGRVTFVKQYTGKDEASPYFFVGYSRTGAVDVTMDYDPEEEVFTGNGSVGLSSSITTWSTAAFYNGLLIGTPPTPIDVPEGLQTEALVLRGRTYNGSAWSDVAEDATVNVGFDGDDVYFQGLLTDVPEGWVKGTITTNEDGTKKVVIPTGQYVGKDTQYGSGTYLVGYINGTGIADAELSYFEDGPYFVSENFIFSNGKKNKMYYNYYYSTNTTIGISGAENALNDAIDEAEELVADESNEAGVDELNAAIQAALAALNTAIYPEDYEAALKALQEAIDAFKKANSAKPEEEVTVVEGTATWVAAEYAEALKWKNAEVIPETTIEEAGITVTFDKGSSTNAPAYYSKDADARFYKGNKLTLSGKGINKVVFYYLENCTGNIEVKDGEIEVDTDAKTVTWTGEADEIVFTNGGSTNVQLRFTKFDVSYKSETTVDNRVYLKGGEANDGKFYATYYNGEEPYAVSGEGVTAYTATVDDDKESLILEEIEDGLIPAGAAVILIAEAEDITLVPGKPYTRDFNNVLVGFDEETQIESGSYYGLAVKNGVAGYYKVVLESVPGNKAYLKAEDAAAAKQFIPFGKTTAVDVIEAAEAQKGGVVYNLQGQRVSNAQKGIYIIGGKKVIKK